MTRSPNITVDMLIHAARCAVNCHEHVADRLGEHGVCDDLPDETDWLADRMSTLHLVAREFTRYSDGRPVSACEVIDTGVHVHHVFPAIVEHRGEQPDGVVTVGTMRHQLRDHRVVEGRDFVALLDAGFDPDRRTCFDFAQHE